MESNIENLNISDVLDVDPSAQDPSCRVIENSPAAGSVALNGVAEVRPLVTFRAISLPKRKSGSPYMAF